MAEQLAFFPAAAPAMVRERRTRRPRLSLMAERLYGTISYDEARRLWVVECEPQVRQRMKRVFPKIKQRATELEIADNIDAGRDIEWFLERYPMQIADDARVRLGKAAGAHRKLVEDIGRMLTADYKPVGADLAVPLRQYQSVAVDLGRRVGGLLLADDLGVGKTAVGIGLLADPAARPALVVTLTHLPRQWKREIERFLPGLSVDVLTKGRAYEFKRNGEPYIPDVIISNYHKLAGWCDDFAGLIRTVVFDEVHELRREGSAKYNSAAMIAGESTYRLGLTGTPIFNYGGEMWNILDVLRPGALGTWSEFATEWCGGFEDKAKAQIKDPKAFGAYVREAGLMLRRTRAEVGRELPALTVCPHTIEADLDELDKIEGKAVELAKLVLADGLRPWDKLKAADELSWKLRQATGLAKAPFVAQFVRLLVESGESVLLAGWHHAVYSIWGEQLQDLNPAFFTGDENPSAKEKSAQAFVDGKTKLLIMSLRAGAGIDGLQKVCRTVVFGELDWAPAVHEQFTGRVYRDGQTDPVAAYYLLADCGSDPVMADVLGVKRAQLEGIRDPNAALIKHSQTDPDRIKKLAAAYLAQKKG